MELIDKIKLFLNIGNSDKDALIMLFIDLAKEYIISYCNLSEYSTNFDNLVVQMVIEDFNRQGSEGLVSQSVSGASESYLQDYSQKILKTLSKSKKIKTL